MSYEFVREAVVPAVGDEIQVVGTKVDRVPRTGVVIEVRGRLVTVQWVTGEQSVFVPAPGTVTVIGHSDARRPRRARGAVPSRSSKKKQQPARKASVRATRKSVAKTTGRKAPARKAARSAVTRRPSATKKTPTKRAAVGAKRKSVATTTARKAPARKTATKRPSTTKATRKRAG